MMEVQKLNLIQIRECLEKYETKKELNNFIENVIDDIVLNGLSKNFDFSLFKNLKIDMNLLNKHLNNNSRNLEILLYNLVLYDVEPRAKIKALALRKCKWNELINLCNMEKITLEEYEEVLLNSLPYANYEAIFLLDVNVNKVKRRVYEEILDDNFNYGYYLLFPVLIANTECDKYNIAFSKKLIENTTDDINYLILDTLRFFLKNYYNKNIKDIDKIVMLNYDDFVQNRPDILLIYINFRTRLLEKERTMGNLLRNYLDSEENKEMFNQIVSGEVTDVALKIKNANRKISLNNIIEEWLKNGNYLAVATYINYFLGFLDYEIGEQLDQKYLRKKKERKN